MPPGQQVRDLRQLLQAAIQRLAGAHQVRHGRGKVGKQQELGHRTVPLPVEAGQDTVREAGEVLCPRAGPDDPGLQQAGDVPLHVGLAETHPAGDEVGALCHPQPRPALVREPCAAIGFKAPWGQGHQERRTEAEIGRAHV